MIDLLLCSGINFFAEPYIGGYLPGLSTPSVPFIGSLSLTSNSLILLLYFTLSTGLTGRTVGKWICRLRVVDEYGERPSFWMAVGREVLKLVAVLTQIGAYIALAMLLFYNRSTWYDQVCRTEVDFIGHLSATQRNWRKRYNRY